MINRRIIRALNITLAFSAISLCWAASAWAAQEFEFTRETYDLLMRWVNFIILAALIIKYARRPIANFLKEKKEEVAVAIERLETQKQAAKDKLSACQSELSANEKHLELIKQKIIAEGETRKAELIAGAQNDSRIMMETAQLRIEHMVRESRGQIKSDLIDAATEIALSKIPDMLTEKDHDLFIHQWMDAVQH